MELQYLIVKIPIEGPLKIDPEKVVDVLHRWVGTQSVPGVLLIDVAELLHVPKGPGVVAVGVEADYALDHTGGVWGVLYRRKADLGGTNADRLVQAFEAAKQGGAWLEEAFPGSLKFSRTEFEIIINDRALAPNTPETRAAALPEIESTLRSLLGTVQVEQRDRDPRRRFSVTVKAAQPFAFGPLAAR